MPIEIPTYNPCDYQQAMYDANFAWFEPWNSPLAQHHLWSTTELYEWQAAILEFSSLPVSRWITSTNNESGKTSEIIPTLGLSFMTAFPGGVVNSTAGSESQVKDQLFRYLAAKLQPWLTANQRDSTKWWISPTQMMLLAPEVRGQRSLWRGRVPADAYTAEGYHRSRGRDSRGNPILKPVMLIFDEAKSIPASMFNMARRINPDFMLVISTPPEDDTGHFVELLDQESLKDWRPRWNATTAT